MNGEWMRADRTACAHGTLRFGDDGIEVQIANHSDVFEMPVLIRRVVPRPRQDFGSVVFFIVVDVENLAVGSVNDSIAFEHPLLIRSSVERFHFGFAV